MDDRSDGNKDTKNSAHGGAEMRSIEYEGITVQAATFTLASMVSLSALNLLHRTGTVDSEDLCRVKFSSSFQYEYQN